jgi:hypothetical protein
MGSKDARHEGALKRAICSCDKCRFWSDLKIKPDPESSNGIKARCLNPRSSHRGNWRAAQDSCRVFNRGEAIDTPNMNEAA